jgi:single-strand DNA-binding protein|tara:strand:+ start:11456 stop:11857 length:402 start_codon:yes stop_codon:yes gene_type:complete
MINSFVGTGRLTQDPDFKEIKDTQVCSFTYAINDPYDKENKYTLFMPVVVFGKQAINCSKYLSKGSEVSIQGRLRTEKWQAKDGSNRTSIKLKADLVQFGAKPSGEATTSTAKVKEVPTEVNSDNTSESEIPF